MRLGLGLSITGVRGGVRATALPQSASVVAYWDAADIVGTNGATFQTWTDRVGGIVADQATAGARATLTTNQLNGLPCARFSGAQYMTIATPGALRTAVDSYNYTVLIVARLRASASSCCLFGATAGGNSFFYTLNGTTIGRFSEGAVPYTSLNSFVTFGSAMSNQYSGIASSQYYEQVYVQGTPAVSIVSTAIASGANGFAIGSTASGALKANADVFAILVWNRTLTPVEYLQAQMWACERWGQPYPWSSVSRMVVFDGDSITAGVGASAPQFAMPYRVASALGLSYGQWMNNGVGGITAANMAAIAPNRVDGIPALIGKDIALVAHEWYNQRGAAPTPYNASLAYLTGRKAASARIKTVWGTSTDNTTDNANQTNRTAYNTAWDSYWAGAHPLIDSYVPIHNDASIGASGSFAAGSATYWAGDGVHLKDAGYAVLAPLMTAGVNALP